MILIKHHNMPQGSGRLKCSVGSAPAPGVGGSFEIGLCLEVGAAKQGTSTAGQKVITRIIEVGFP